MIEYGCKIREEGKESTMVLACVARRRGLSSFQMEKTVEGEHLRIRIDIQFWTYQISIGHGCTNRDVRKAAGCMNLKIGGKTHNFTMCIYIKSSCTL